MVKKRIIVASSKGGVGKSTVSCGIAIALAEAGHRVLLADCDFGNPCLDLMLSCENDSVYNIFDVANGVTSPDKALVKLGEYGELYFVPAAVCQADKLSPDKLGDALGSLEKAVDADYVILDTSSGITVPVMLAENYADSALIVATQTKTSLRAAENLAVMLDETKLRYIRLVISSFDADSASSGERPGILKIIMESRVQALGVVPYEYALMLSVRPPEKKRKRKKLAAFTAFGNIAARIDGADVPLFNSIKPLRRRLVY